MSAFIFLFICIAVCFALGMRRADLRRWAIALAVMTLLWRMGAASGTLYLPHFGSAFLASFLPAIVLGLLSVRTIRRQVITTPMFSFVKTMLPPVSATEREALEAGTVGFDAELFSGEPNWAKLRAVRR